MGAAERGGGDFREAQVFDLSFSMRAEVLPWVDLPSAESENSLFQLSHSLDRLLHRRHPIQTMAIIQIYRRYSQPLQTLLASFLDILRVAPHRHLAVCEMNGEFRGQEDLITFAGSLEPFADQVFAVHVHVCRIPEVGAQFVGFVEDLEARFVVFGGAVKG